MKILKCDVSVLDIARHASSSNKLIKAAFSVRLDEELEEVKGEKDEGKHRDDGSLSEVKARQQT